MDPSHWFSLCSAFFFFENRSTSYQALYMSELKCIASMYFLKPSQLLWGELTCDSVRLLRIVFYFLWVQWTCANDGVDLRPWVPQSEGPGGAVGFLSWVVKLGGEDENMGWCFRDESPHRWVQGDTSHKVWWDLKRIRALVNTWLLSPRGYRLPRNILCCPWGDEQVIKTTQLQLPLRVLRTSLKETYTLWNRLMGFLVSWVALLNVLSYPASPWPS